MTITFNELRSLKDRLPNGSMARIAQLLHLNEDTVRNYFGAEHLKTGSIPGIHFQAGPEGGIVKLEDDTIYQLAIEILGEHR